MSEGQGAGIPLSDIQLREVLNKMHVGLITMQSRLDDHEKVIEKLMIVIQNLTEGQVPKGFRQPPREH